MNLKHNIVNHSTMKTSSKLTSKESFAILHKIENEKYPTDGSIKLSDWCDQMQKARLEAIKDLVPEVGLGCTICYYSDKRAATVTKIVSPCKIEVTFNQTKCIDYYAGEYEILSELEGDAKVFSSEAIAAAMLVRENETIPAIRERNQQQATTSFSAQRPVSNPAIAQAAAGFTY